MRLLPIFVDIQEIKKNVVKRDASAATAYQVRGNTLAKLHRCLVTDGGEVCRLMQSLLNVQMFEGYVEKHACTARNADQVRSQLTKNKERVARCEVILA